MKSGGNVDIRLLSLLTTRTCNIFTFLLAKFGISVIQGNAGFHVGKHEEAVKLSQTLE